MTATAGQPDGVRRGGPARWLKRPRRDEPAAVRLFCFHHAGGAASLYRQWPQLLPSSIEPIAVQLPGRAERFGEPPYDAMNPLLDALADVLGPLLGEPYACYGLSMGARVAWALTHRLRQDQMPLPVALYLASAAAPDWEENRHNWDPRTADLVGYLRTMGGTPPEVFSAPELVESLLPTLRADLVLVDTFRMRPAVPLDVPIHAFAGADDVEGGPQRMSGWRDQTRARFDLDVVPGGHFFDAAGERHVMETVTGDLLRQIAVPDAADVP
jgi:surfactin synthase thioesterase subunit